MTGYKVIIKNMVEMEVTRYVEKKSGKFIEIEKTELSTTNGFDYPTFDCEISVGLGEIIKYDYRIHGYIDDYGSVVISSASYTRKFRKDGETKFQTVSKFLTRDELDSFKFAS